MMKKFIYILVLGGLMFMLQFPSLYAQVVSANKVIYVSYKSNQELGIGEYEERDGSDWQHAIQNLQTAIDMAKITRSDVWVQGNMDPTNFKYYYYPTSVTTDEYGNTGSDDRWKSFIMHQGVHVYGGFHGFIKAGESAYELINDSLHVVVLAQNLAGETSVDQRVRTKGSKEGISFELESYAEWALVYPSILSGDVDGGAKNDSTSSDITIHGWKWDDDAKEWTCSYRKNSYHVVTFCEDGFYPTATLNAGSMTTPVAIARGMTESSLEKDKAILDGFVIMGGQANQKEEYCINSLGGGVLLTQGGVVRNSIIAQNFSQFGGAGVFMNNGGEVDHCLVFRNAAPGLQSLESKGGGIFSLLRGNMNNLRIADNTAYYGGGVFFHDGKDNPHLPDTIKNVRKPWDIDMYNTIIANNTASIEAGGVYMDGAGVISTTTIANNNCLAVTSESEGRTGGLFMERYGILVNTALWGNLANETTFSQLFSTGVGNGANDLIRYYSCAIQNITSTEWGEGSVLANSYGLSSYNNPTDDPDQATTNTYDYPRFQTIRAYTKGVYHDYLADDIAGTSNINAVVNNANKLRFMPSIGSYLLNKGRAIADAPYVNTANTILAQIPENDTYNIPFKEPRPIGAFMGNRQPLNPIRIVDPLLFELDNYGRPTATNLEVYALFVDPNITNDGDGSCWEEATSQIYDAIETLVAVRDTTESRVSPHNYYVIYVKEGTIVPNVVPEICKELYPDQWSEMDRRSCTLPLYSRLVIRGGYSQAATGTQNGGDILDVIEYPTFISGDRSKLGIDATNDESLYHVITCIDTAFSIGGRSYTQIEGCHITNGNAYGSAQHDTLTFGAGINVWDKIELCVNRCIISNNRASEGAAIYGPNTSKLVMNACVVNNNISNWPIRRSIIGFLGNKAIMNCTVTNNEGHGFTLNHRNLLVNNLFYGNTYGSYYPIASSDTALIEVMWKNNALQAITPLNNNCWDPTGNSTWRPNANGNNLLLGDISLANFVNPTTVTGFIESGYSTINGGQAVWEPCNNGAKINKAINNGIFMDQLFIELNNLGSPFVTLFNLVSFSNTDIRGIPYDHGGLPDIGAHEATTLPLTGKCYYVTPNGAGNMDGSSWNNAISGNAVYDLESNATTPLVILGGDTITTSHASYNTIDGAYAEQNDARFSSTFWTSAGNVSATKTITNNRYQRYVSGLQYAVEKASQDAKNDTVNHEVWACAGVYTDIKGYVIRDSVDVYGSFPATGGDVYGSPGKEDRFTLLSSRIPASDDDVLLASINYETVLQISPDAPVTWSLSNSGDTTGYYVPTKKADLPFGFRRSVLYQPDVCLPTTDINNDTERYTSGSDANYVEYGGAMWDGFTIRHGYINGNNFGASNDGGAGVRAFRGVKISNCVIMDNIASINDSINGGGVYMNGTNSELSNCFVVNNAIKPRATGIGMGGGVALFKGTSYNTVISNNFSSIGGGVITRNATIFNNTIANNFSGVTGGIYQRRTGDTSPALNIFNCILFDNAGSAINSQNWGKFSPLRNCYVATTTALAPEGNTKITTANGNRFGIKGSLSELTTPFSDLTPQDDNDYRILSNSFVINAGRIDSLLPSIDINKKLRIQDCTPDIGAYENLTLTAIIPTIIQYDKDRDGVDDNVVVFFVNKTGSGDVSARNWANAAGETKMQQVLDYAHYIRMGLYRTAPTQVFQAYASPDAVAPTNFNLANYPYFEVWVARGTYVPQRKFVDINERTESWMIGQGISVYGGFEGTDMNERPDTRDLRINQTIFSGQLNSQSTDASTFAYTVVGLGVTIPRNVNPITEADPTDLSKWYREIDTEYALYGPALLNGVTIINGNSDHRTASYFRNGGGVYMDKGSRLENCIVAENRGNYGGGIFMNKGAVVTGCLVRDNTANYGGGIYLSDSTLVFACTIVQNETTVTGKGGGVYYLHNSETDSRINSTVIWQNSSINGKNIYEELTGVHSGEIFSYCAVEGERPYGTENMELSSVNDVADYSSDENVYYPNFNNIADNDFSISINSNLYRNGATITSNDHSEGDYKYFTEYDMYGENRFKEGNTHNAVTERKTVKGNGSFEIGAYAVEEIIELWPIVFESELGSFYRLYVSQSRKGHGNGHTWRNSINSPQDALDFFANDDNFPGKPNRKCEIWISEGNYSPTRRIDTTTCVGEEASLSSFVLNPYTTIYGGFQGSNAFFYESVAEEFRYEVDGRKQITESPATTNIPLEISVTVNEEDVSSCFFHLMTSASLTVTQITFYEGEAIVHELKHLDQLPADTSLWTKEVLGDSVFYSHPFFRVVEVKNNKTIFTRLKGRTIDRIKIHTTGTGWINNVSIDNRMNYSTLCTSISFREDSIASINPVRYGTKKEDPRFNPNGTIYMIQSMGSNADLVSDNRYFYALPNNTMRAYHQDEVDAMCAEKIDSAFLFEFTEVIPESFYFRTKIRSVKYNTFFNTVPSGNRTGIIYTASVPVENALSYVIYPNTGKGQDSYSFRMNYISGSSIGDNIRSSTQYNSELVCSFSSGATKQLYVYKVDLDTLYYGDLNLDTRTYSVQNLETGEKELDQRKYITRNHNNTTEDWSFKYSTILNGQTSNAKSFHTLYYNIDDYKERTLYRSQRYVMDSINDTQPDEDVLYVIVMDSIMPTSPEEPYTTRFLSYEDGVFHYKTVSTTGENRQNELTLPNAKALLFKFDIHDGLYSLVPQNSDTTVYIKYTVTESIDASVTTEFSLSNSLVPRTFPTNRSTVATGMELITYADGYNYLYVKHASTQVGGGYRYGALALSRDTPPVWWFNAPKDGGANLSNNLSGTQLRFYKVRLDSVQALGNGVNTVSWNIPNENITNRVLVNGVTVRNGSATEEGTCNAMNRQGGGLWTNGNMMLQASTFDYNEATNAGGAVYSKGDTLIVASCLMGGNAALGDDTYDVTSPEYAVTGRGGALYKAAVPNKPTREDTKLYVVNSLIINNDAANDGSALFGEDSVRIFGLNNTIARNRWLNEPSTDDGGSGAGYHNGVIDNTTIFKTAVHSENYDHNQYNTVISNIPNSERKAILVNCVVWGNNNQNRFTKKFEQVNASPLPWLTYYCAADPPLRTVSIAANLERENNNIQGPRFGNPSAVSGIDGYSVGIDFSIHSKSVLVDAGEKDGERHLSNITRNNGVSPAQTFQSLEVADTTVARYYYDERVIPTDSLMGYYYMQRLMGKDITPNIIHQNKWRISREVDKYYFYEEADGSYTTKVGSWKEGTIDIGAYEYQHAELKPFTGNIVYVTSKENVESGVENDGSTWEQATSNLSEAIRMLISNSNNKNKYIKMMSGTYVCGVPEDDYIFHIVSPYESIDMGHSVPEAQPIVTSLTIRGGYPDVIFGNDTVMEQYADVVETPTIIRGFNDNFSRHLFMVHASMDTMNALPGTTRDLGAPAPVNFERLEFCLGNVAAEADDTIHDGAAICALNSETNIRFCRFYDNFNGDTANVDTARHAAAVYMHGGSIYNSLFHNNSLWGVHNVAYHSDSIYNNTFALNSLGGLLLNVDSIMNKSDIVVTANNLYWGNGPGITYEAANDRLLFPASDTTNTQIVRKQINFDNRDLIADLFVTSPIWNNMAMWNDAYSGLDETKHRIKTSFQDTITINGVLGKTGYEVFKVGDVRALTGIRVISPINKDLDFGPQFIDVPDRNFRIRAGAQLLNTGQIIRNRRISQSRPYTYGEKIYLDSAETADVSELYYRDLFGTLRTGHYSTFDYNVNGDSQSANEEKIEYFNDAWIDSRLSAGIIDIGACEYNNIFYPNIFVVKNAIGKGSSWDDPTGDFKGALLAAYYVKNGNARGTVWVKGGDFPMTEYDFSSTNIIWREGVSAYGGFNGYERDLSSRPEPLTRNVTYSNIQLNGRILEAHADKIVTNDTLIWGVMDGFIFSDETGNIYDTIPIILQNGFALKGCVIEEIKSDTAVISMQNGALIYNSLIDSITTPADMPWVIMSDTMPASHVLTEGEILKNKYNPNAIINVTLVQPQQRVFKDNIIGNVNVGTALREGYIANTLGWRLPSYSLRHDDTNMDNYSPFAINYIGNPRLKYQLNEISRYGTQNMYDYYTGEALQRDTVSGGKSWKKIVRDDQVTYHIPVLYRVYNPIAQAYRIEPIIDYQTDRDLIGNKRLFKQTYNSGSIKTKPSFGCFEPIFISASTTFLLDSIYNPVEGSVVYADSASTLILKNYASHTFVFAPEYLLLRNNAQLIGNGDSVALEKVSVEREIKGGNWALTSLPFSYSRSQSTWTDGPSTIYRNGNGYNLRRTEMTVGNGTATATNIEQYYYDGEKRANARYKSYQDESPNWTEVSIDSTIASSGYLIRHMSTDTLVRFSANSGAEYSYIYTESPGKPKTIVLQQYNLNDKTGGAEFTYAENMGWNLIGNPFLSRYPYKKINIPHTFYNFSDDENTFVPIQSWENTGHLRTGEGLFTQTSTLQPTEVLYFPQPVAADTADTRSAQYSNVVRMSISNQAEKRRDYVEIIPETGVTNALQFDMGNDALKFMSFDETVPQIFVNNSEGVRFAITTSADQEGSTPIGISTGAEGTYTIALENGFGEDYELILLVDQKLGVVKNLHEGSYTFTISQEDSGDDTGRFLLRFARGLEEEKEDEEIGDIPYLFQKTNGMLGIGNLIINDQIFIYDTAGKLWYRQKADDSIKEIPLDAKIYIITVLREDKRVLTKKYKLK